MLLRPTMSFMLVQTPDPRTIKDALPSFSQTSHIFLPINDCRAPNVAEGGSHWSLLLVSLVDGIAFHYDSLHGSNSHFASQTTSKMATLLQRPLRFVELHDSPQQNNGSDCGVFVCIIMKYLLVKRLLSTHNNDKISMSMGSTSIDSNKGRRDMLKLIEEFRREGRRSMSRSRSPFGGRPSSDGPPRIGDP